MIEQDKLPQALRETGRFCLWKYEERDGKRTKVPYNPRTGGRAQASNRQTFTTYQTAKAALERGGYDGLGVGVFDRLCAIDIDHCLKDGAFTDLAVEILETMHAYTELSPSGAGLRILFRAPEGFRYDTGRYYINNHKLGLEIYAAGVTRKFVTVTGNKLPAGPDTLEERGKEVLEVLEKYMQRPRKTSTTPPPGVSLEDGALLEKARNAAGGNEFSALWEGNTGGYGSRSEADLALCNRLAFWTGRDVERMDRLFRQSGLMREKWDRPQSGSTYGRITLQAAAESCGAVYDPRPAKTPTTAGLVQLRPDSSPRYGWNDIGNGNLFADWYRDTARYVPARRKWYLYNGPVWKPDDGGLLAMELCKQLADSLLLYAASIQDERQRKAYLDHVRRWQGRRSRETILKDAAGVYPAALEAFDKDPYLYNCQNGTLDLRTREFRKHSPGDLLTMVSGARYDPAARCGLWEKVINDAMQGDRDKTLFLQKAMGYGLTGDTSEECFFLLYGATTRNGKGTAMETYMRMQGDYGRVARSEAIAQKEKPSGGSPNEDIARLMGTRVVNISEPEKGMILSAALVKTLTGNDKINARFLHENSFEFYPQFKFFINTNHLPKITDATIFDSGRVKVIPFERHFTEKEQDKGLKKKLASPENLSGILNWCLDGLRLVQETGFDLPPSIQAATEQYRRESDKVTRFVEEMMERDITGEIRTEEAYRVYQGWCTRNGQYAEAMPSFKQSMETHGEIKRKRPNGAGRDANPAWYIRGLRWK